MSDVENRMKLVLAYIASFLVMTVITAAILYGFFAFVIGAIAFVTWSLPGAHVDWLTALRACISVGTLFGVWYICSKEGQQSAKEFVNEYLS